MLVNAYVCNSCGDAVFSRARHDMRYCTCGGVAVDGGFDYAKLSGDPASMDRVLVNVDATKAELYNDWSTQANKYGLVPAKDLPTGQP